MRGEELILTLGTELRLVIGKRLHKPLMIELVHYNIPFSLLTNMTFSKEESFDLSYLEGRSQLLRSTMQHLSDTSPGVPFLGPVGDPLGVRMVGVS